MALKSVCADVEIQGVAKFIWPRNAAGLDASGKVARVVAAEAAAAERAEQILKSLEAEKIDGLVGDLKARIGIALLRIAQLAARRVLRRRSDLRRLLRVDEAFLGEAFHELVDQLADIATVQRAGILQHFAKFLAHGVVGQQVAFLQGSENGVAQGFHRLVRNRIQKGRNIAIRSRSAGRSRPGASLVRRGRQRRPARPYIFRI